MSDLENRAREAARQEQEEQARLRAKQDRINTLAAERDRTAKAELADDALEKALGVRLGPDQWHKRDLGPPDYSGMNRSKPEDWGVVAQVEGVTVCWKSGRLYLANRPNEFYYGDDVTLASYGRKLGQEKATKQTPSTPPPRRPWYKKGRP